MRNYKVFLTRVYAVDIEAQDQDKAKEMVEFYVGDPADASMPAERTRENFSIGEIELMVNEATEVEEIKE
jgi:hypothetical protein